MQDIMIIKLSSCIFDYLGVRAKLVTVRATSLTKSCLAIQRVERNLYFIIYHYSRKVYTGRR